MAAPRKIDYERLEPAWRAGIKSPAQLAADYTADTGVAVSATAIVKHFKKHDIPRDLRAKVKARSDAMVLAAMVRGKVGGTGPTDREVVDGNATAIATIDLGHRRAVRTGREIVERLLNELGESCDPELWSSIRALAAPPLIDPSPEQKAEQERRSRDLADALERATAFPSRVAGARALADAMRVLITLEREIVGLDKSEADPLGGGRILSDVERAARLMSILDRAKRAKAEADARAVASAAIATAKG